MLGPRMYLAFPLLNKRIYVKCGPKSNEFYARYNLTNLDIAAKKALEEILRPTALKIIEPWLAQVQIAAG